MSILKATHSCRFPRWSPWGCLRGSTTVKSQNNSDSVHSEIPFNLSHLLLRAVLLSFMRSVFILCRYDDRFLFDQHDRIIPCWCSREPCGGGSSRGLALVAAPCQSELTSQCRDLSVGDAMSPLSFDQLKHRCFSPSLLLQSSFHLFPGSVCMFTCMFCNCHSLIFLNSQHFSPPAEEMQFTRVWRVTLEQASLTAAHNH